MTTPLNPTIFGAPIRRQLLFDVVQAYLANKRQGTAKAKFRSEVAGSTRKIYRQKGTGNARHGDIKANIFVGGGIAFPPRPRNWEQRVPQKMRRGALITALSLRNKEGNLTVVEDFVVNEIKTKTLVKQFEKWKFGKGLLIVETLNEKLWKSARNLPHIAIAAAQNLNALDLLAHEKVMVTEGALKALEKRLL